MQCKKTKCAAHAVKGKEFCFFHDPENKEERKVAASKGGKGKSTAIVFVM